MDFFTESSDKLKKRFIKLAKPVALQNAIVGQHTNDKSLENKGKRTLDMISKVQSRLLFPKKV